VERAGKSVPATSSAHVRGGAGDVRRAGVPFGARVRAGVQRARATAGGSARVLSVIATFRRLTSTSGFARGSFPIQILYGTIFRRACR